MLTSRRRWIALGMCLLAVPLVLYALLPSAAALVLQYLLSQQGYQQVTMRLGYPGWHTLHVPQVSLVKRFGATSLTLTVAQSRLDYDLASLFAGRLTRLTLGHVTLLVQGPGQEPAPPCQTPDTPPEGPGLFSWLTAGHALLRLPTLPVQTVVLERGRVWQACATGPLREVRLSGTVQQRDARLTGALTVQGQETAVYRLALMAAPGGEYNVTLHAEPAAARPLLALHTHIQPGPAGVSLDGTLAVDFTLLAPLLTALPAAMALPQVDGTLQAQWHAAVPPSIPLERVWQHSATSIVGEASCTVRLPNASALGHNFSVAMHAEVAGTPMEATYTLEGTLKQAHAVEEARWDVHGTLAMEAQQVRGTVGAASSVRWSKAHLGDVVLPTGTLRLTDLGTVRANWGSLAWEAGPVAVALQVPSLVWNAAQVRLTEAALTLDTVHGDARGWQAAGTLVASGQYEDMHITALTARMALQATDKVLRAPEPLVLSVRTLQAGVELQDIGLQLHPVWEPYQAVPVWVELRDLHATLLGGYLRSPGWRYTLGQRRHMFPVQVEHLDIQQLLQLEQQQGLEGTGHLDGTLPLMVTPTGVQVQDGYLEARAPGGVLRYHPTKAADLGAALSEAPLAFVMQALTNLHYNVLRLGVQYAEDGTLGLSARIEGHNPDWQQGRPIHLNLQVQENIPALLQSLRLLQGDGVQHSISEHLQRRPGKDTAP